METLRNQGNAGIVLQVIDAIHEQASYLSEIDGATGDGDHGINMNKGFMMAKERIEPSVFCGSFKNLRTYLSHGHWRQYGTYLRHHVF